MAQVSFLWKQILNIIASSPSPPYKSRAFRSISRSRLRFLTSVILGLAAVVALFFWNWKLLLATLAGIGVMLLVYLLQDWDWQQQWQKWRQFLRGSNQQLFIAVGSGGIAALSIYLATSIWVDSESPSLATAAILQGGGTALTLVLLLWQILSRSSQSQSQLEQQLNNLSDANALKRLIAVQQLTHLASHQQCSASQRKQIMECFRLLLSQEKEASIREAVWESLQTFDRLDPLTPAFAVQVPPLRSRPIVRQYHSP